ncbi:YlbG family protein [Desemzia sp. RIT804]|uniref:YlbG family protein n=1 Tax=Desemzia sp. RIT 804 TaxID=2810209 RepID=UPI001951DFD1|nr:YlbG family protein [Desemzia sp. RIT 804]MBM6613617.1 YlbG family protein [Desemzia sp. RIT 804]
MELEVNERQGIIVWVYSLKHMKTLKRQGLIHYVSKRMKYVVLYVNRSEIDATEKKLNSFHFVRKVERSYRTNVDMDFAHVLEEISQITEEKTTEEVFSGVGQMIH